MNGQLPDTLRVPAPAKVNVFLRVLGRRPDGYHELETLIAPVELADVLEIHAHSDPEAFRTLALSLEVTGDAELVSRIPLDDSNLVLRAAHALAEEAGVRGFADITLEKHVPVAAGLGGGSADAAATLQALNRLWECGLGRSALGAIGASVGSDVPALLAGGPVLARGRGDRVEPVALPPIDLALVTFPFGVSTVDAFRWWDEDGGPTGPDPRDALAAASEGTLRVTADLLFNDLEAPVMRRIPEIREARDALVEAGAAGVVMCGSGPTLAAPAPALGGFQPPEGFSIRWVRTVTEKGDR